MWKAGVSIKEVDFDKNLIAVKVFDSVTDWLLVGFYGPPYYFKKKKAWGNLFALLESHQGPWACIGDFNCILNEDEQVEGCKGSSSAINYLKELLFEFNVVDLGYSRNKFTWAKDHAPIMLDTNPSDTFAHRPFRFEAVWLRDDRCRPVIEKAWNIDVSRFEFTKLYKRQAATRDALRKWNKEPSRINEVAEQALQTELSEWLIRSEDLWRQKSRELWLKLGDKNSRFFHLSTIIRRMKNNVDAIKKEDGTWIYESNQIRKLFRDTFIELFKEEEISFPEHLEHLVLPCITEDENDVLEKIPSPEEIKAVLFEMQDLKAPGPDGFPALFYKQLWPTVGNDLVKAVTSFFTRGTMPKEVNCSLIVLIPKISNPTSVNHFRPISLCNVVYKIISKLLVAKLRHLLDKIISPTQSAFIPNRWISENQIVVQEILHSFKSRKTKPGLMAVKLDLQKAYDRVNWKFIQAILLHLGFNEVFTSWVTACVSSVSFEVLVNGGKTECFKPCRGLRQRDPLSPYLFILGQEILSRLIDHELKLKNINGIKTSISGPTITHVMYVDDIVLFLKASRKDAACLVRTLDKYCRWSGQYINMKKSGVFFSKHTQSQTKSIPNKVCDRLDSLTRRFWWKPNQSEGRYIAWKAWDSLCCPRSVGGLGFKKAKNINSVLLAKLAWMIASKRDSLCMRILRAKYKVKEDWLRAEAKKTRPLSGKQLKRQGQLSSKAHVTSLEMANLWTFGATPGYHGSKDLFQLQNMKLHPRQPSKFRISLIMTYIAGRHLLSMISLFPAVPKPFSPSPFTRGLTQISSCGFQTLKVVSLLNLLTKS
ncbi:hypothetical protein SO802_025705 [Lithocarpus litseifolius]|uniref:Reverse transcriptase domain-containing protein n=1 Tax=Lithocarpus litseifolius TaxID=425828 RepID=A0AAW2C308_9ROSI